MPGYDKRIVVDSVQAELDAVRKTADQKHVDEVAKHERKLVKLELNRSSAHHTAIKIAEKISEGEYQEAKKLTEKLAGARYESGEIDNISDPGAAPERISTGRERALQRVIDVIESQEQSTVTVSDLRSWGIFDIVRSASGA